MKQSISILVFLFFAANVYSQAPERISYQAVIRNTSNQLVINKQVGMRISIQKYMLGIPPTYTNIYVETQKPTTNDNGLVTLQIGGGAIVGGTFGSINWSDGTYYIQIETDPTGGTNYSITGKSQVLSVPYAINAKNVDNVRTDETLTGKGNTTQPLKLAQQEATKGQVLQWDGDSWNPGTNFSVGATGYWSPFTIKRLGFYSFKTKYSSPLLISFQDLGLKEEDIRYFFIINLQVGWAEASYNGTTQYRSTKDGIYYEECNEWSPSGTFKGIKVYFPDKQEYHDRDGKLTFMLGEKNTNN